MWRKLVWGLVSLFLLILVAAFGWWLWTHGPAPTQAQAAASEPPTPPAATTTPVSLTEPAPTPQAEEATLASPPPAQTEQEMSTPESTVTPPTHETTLVGWPASPEEFFSWVTEGQPSPPPDESWMPIELGEIHNCVGEDTCWAVAREKDLQAHIVPFWVRNPTSCMQDGWMESPDERAQLGRTSPPSAVGSGIPAQWSGLAQGTTFRPCQ